MHRVTASDVITFATSSTAILDLVHVLASILRKTLVANSRQQRARMHENLNISGTSNHRGWWVVSALLALPQLCRTAPKSSGWVGAV